MHYLVHSVKVRVCVGFVVGEVIIILHHIYLQHRYLLQGKALEAPSAAILGHRTRHRTCPPTAGDIHPVAGNEMLSLCFFGTFVLFLGRALLGSLLSI